MAMEFSDRRPVIAPKAAPLRSVVEEMLKRERYHAVLVDEEDRAWGVLSIRDVANAVFIVGEESVELLEAGSLGKVLENTSYTYASHPAITASSDISLREAVRIMNTRNIGCLPLVDEAGRIVGVLDEKFIVKAIPETCRKNPCEIASWNPLCIEEGEEILVAAGLMLSAGVRRLVVLDSKTRMTSLNLVIKHLMKPDNLKIIMEGGRKPLEDPVSVISMEPWVVDCTYNLKEVASIISFDPLGAVLVRDSGRIGVLTERDLLRALAEELEPE